MKRPRRPVLLAYRALGLGDLLTAVPALRAAAAAWPDHRRVLATTSGVAPLARHLGVFDAVVATRAFEPLPLRRIDLAVNLHGRGPQSHRLLLAYAPGRLIAFAHPAIPETRALPRWRSGEHEVLRWCRLLRAAGVPADESRLEISCPARPVPPGVAGATVVHPGAGSRSRCWPPVRWASVARAELAAGRRVVVTGSTAERSRALRVARTAGLDESSVLAGRTDLLGLAAVIGAAGRVVCSDTGVAHLATALATPSVVLFGPTPPALWGPPAERRSHRVLWAGRSGDPHGSTPDPGLLELGVDAVLAELDALASRPKADQPA